MIKPVKLLAAVNLQVTPNWNPKHRPPFRSLNRVRQLLRERRTTHGTCYAFHQGGQAAVVPH